MAVTGAAARRRFAGRTALVIGAGSGIGRTVALAFATTTRASSWRDAVSGP